MITAEEDRDYTPRRKPKHYESSDEVCGCALHIRLLTTLHNNL